MLTLAEFYGILKQITWFYPYQDCLRLNCFAEINSLDDIQSPTFGNSYEDYQNGTFWARDWYSNGHGIVDMNAEWPAMTVYNDGFDAVSPSRGKRVYHLVVNIMAQVGCPTCPDGCPKSTDLIYRELFSIAEYVISQLEAYYRLQMSLVAGGTEYVWGTPEYGAWLVDNDARYNAYSPGIPLMPLVLKAPLKVKKNSFQEIGIGSLLGVFMEIDAEVCETPIVGAAFASPVAAAVGVTAQSFQM